jgi:hypothetical protein
MNPVPSSLVDDLCDFLLEQNVRIRIIGDSDPVILLQVFSPNSDLLDELRRLSLQDFVFLFEEWFIIHSSPAPIYEMYCVTEVRYAGEKNDS